MKRITALLSAFIMLSAMSSCSGKTAVQEETSRKETSIAVEKLSVPAYKKEKLSTPEELSMVWLVMPYESGSKYLMLGSGTSSPMFVRANEDFTEYETVEFPEFDCGAAYSADTANDGTLVAFVNHADYGDLPAPDFSSPDYDEKKYDAAAKYSFMINTYSPDGQLLSSAETEAFTEADKSAFISEVHTDGDLVIAKVKNTYELFRTDGSYLGELTADGDIEVCGRNREGQLVCIVSELSDDGKKLKICPIDSSGKADTSGSSYIIGEMLMDIRPGSGKWSLFIQTNSAIYGFDSSTGEITALFAMQNSGVKNASIIGCMELNGQMAVMTMDDTLRFIRYTPRTEEELENTTVLRLGMIGSSSDIQQFVEQWNDEGHDTRIEIKEYHQDPFDDEKNRQIMDDFTRDMISDQAPDLYSDTLFGNVDLIELGALCDLYELMDGDDSLNRDAFIPNALKCMETNGGLYRLCPSFVLLPEAVAKTKFVGDGSDWNFDTKLKMLSDPPIHSDTYDNAMFDSKLIRSNSIINWRDWTDAYTASCNFTDPNFIRFISWCNEAENLEADNEAWEEWYDSIDQEQHRIDTARQYMDDKVLFYNQTIRSYYDWIELKRGIFNSEPITILGDITFETYSGLSISAKSDKKDLAWEFIKAAFSDDDFLSHNGTPVTKSGLKKAENIDRQPKDWSWEAKNRPELANYTGNVYTIGSDSNDWLLIGSVTDEDAAEFNALVERAVPAARSYSLPQSFYNIGMEELTRFFEGECTAEQCAEALQNRLSIYLSERYG